MSLNINISKGLVPKDTYQLEDITSDYVDLNESLIKNNLCKLKINNNCGFDDFLNVKKKEVANKIKIIEELDAVFTLLIQGQPIYSNNVKPKCSNEFEI